MSAARTASLLFKSVGTALAVVVLISSGWGIANAQTPSNWPAGAPLVAQSGPVLLTVNELTYYELAATNAVAGGLSQDVANARILRAGDCQDTSCPEATRTIVRNEYVQTVLYTVSINRVAPVPPGIAQPPSDGTETPGTGGGTGDPTTGGGGTGEEQSAVGTGDNGDGCSLINGNILTCVQSVGGKIGASILWIFVSLFGWMLGVVGMFFNWVMLVTVFQFATYFGNSAGILLAWSVLRDIGNILLLFGFIFIGLQTILNIGHFNVGKALPRLVIFAILINFSLFVSEAVVDISNAFSASFYSYAGDYNCADIGNSADCTEKGIAGKVLAAAGLTQIFSLDGLSNFSNIWSSDDGIQMFVLYAGLCIFMIVMMITLGAAAIMFMVRAITLMLLLVVSPLGFAGMAIPQFEEQSSKWWKMLISQSFFAPIYLLMIFVGLKIMEGAQAVFNEGGKGTITEALSSTTVSSGGVFILFTLMIGFMIAAMTMAKNFGAVGASFAVNVSSKAVGAATLGTAGVIGRRTIGKASAENAEKMRSSEWAQKHPGMARLMLKSLDYGAAASFDGRKSVSGIAGVKKAGIDLGAANKTAAHGYHGIEEKAIKDREDFYKKLKPSDEQKAASTELKEELDEIKKKQRERVSAEYTNVERARAEVEEARKSGDASRLQSARDNMHNAMEAYEQKIKNPEDEAGKQLNARQKAVEARIKTWNADAERQKTETFIEGTENSSRPNVFNLGGITYNKYTTVGPHADHEVIRKIREGATKSDVDKALGVLAKKLEEKDKDKDEHAGGHAAPPAAGPSAPAGGGHGHGPAH
ncbi:MAG TPA: hypothetical protein VNU47_00105 [Candidatus Paceibacterota bacterium]|nr:hypothetical protein [Candidatus Paceibacterota bacterium]